MRWFNTRSDRWKTASWGLDGLPSSPPPPEPHLGVPTAELFLWVSLAPSCIFTPSRACKPGRTTKDTHTHRTHLRDGLISRHRQVRDHSYHAQLLKCRSFLPFPATIMNFKVVLLCLTLLVLSWLVSPGIKGIQTPPGSEKWTTLNVVSRKQKTASPNIAIVWIMLSCARKWSKLQISPRGSQSRVGWNVPNASKKGRWPKVTYVILRVKQLPGKERQHDEGALQQSTNPREQPAEMAHSSTAEIGLRPGLHTKPYAQRLAGPSTYTANLLRRGSPNSKYTLTGDQSKRAAKGKGKGKGKGKKGGEKGKGKRETRPGQPGGVGPRAEPPTQAGRVHRCEGIQPSQDSLYTPPDGTIAYNCRTAVGGSPTWSPQGLRLGRRHVSAVPQGLNSKLEFQQYRYRKWTRINLSTPLLPSLLPCAFAFLFSVCVCVCVCVFLGPPHGSRYFSLIVCARVHESATANATCANRNQPTTRAGSIHLPFCCLLLAQGKHQCEVDAPMAIRLFHMDLKHVVATLRRAHHYHQFSWWFSNVLARLHVAGERMGLGL